MVFEFVRTICGIYIKSREYSLCEYGLHLFIFYYVTYKIITINDVRNALNTGHSF